MTQQQSAQTLKAKYKKMQPILNALEGSKYNTMLLDCMLATLIGKLLNLANPITDDEASSIDGVIICGVSCKWKIA